MALVGRGRPRAEEVDAARGVKGRIQDQEVVMPRHPELPAAGVVLEDLGRADQLLAEVV